MPAATNTPNALLEQIITTTNPEADVGGVRRLLKKRSVVRSAGANDDAVACHVLTRLVARRLWEAESPPFDSQSDLEPGLTFDVARWFHDEGRSLRNKDDLGAAVLFRTCLSVLDDAGVDLGVEQAVQQCESFVGQARPVYRLPTGRTRADLDRALGWVGDGQRAVAPYRTDDVTAGWYWWSAEAMRGLLVGERCSDRVWPDATDEERLAGRNDALSICAAADEGRKQLAGVMRDMPNPPISSIELDATYLYSGSIARRVTIHH